ncbi:DUF6308 family protein [Ruania suaedae]|uniref:DUF6308 family protein n=1 Tax=Ruania suaedae TaxID=2897774 RepID=UPI001E393E7F|nr:DUF6308 family protein [Ruania suaedae]UFU01869.1 DUF6308 family protein [Ruania suaedae]
MTTGLPTDWSPIPDATLRATREIALAKLRDPRTPEKVARYYDVARTYAGASFTAGYAEAPSDITAADLHATSLLAVKIRPLPTRRFLDDGPLRTAVLDGLALLPVDAALSSADGELLTKMFAFHDAVREAIGPYAWVTTSKVTARKRPNLFPVRDRVVVNVLRLGGPDRRKDWQVFRALMQNDDVLGELARVRIDAANYAADSGIDCKFDEPELRLLDVVLWMNG